MKFKKSWILSDPSSPVEIQLLVFTLVLKKYLLENIKITAVIPKRYYDQLTTQAFEEIVYDSLSQFDLDLGRLLSLEVTNDEHFKINPINQG
jgi:hypothetical protein